MATYRVKTDTPNNKAGSGRTYTIKRATGSTETIDDPFDSFIDMMDRIVKMNADNAVALEFDRLYQQSEGMGIFGRRVESDTVTNRVDLSELSAEVENILNGAGTDTDVMDKVLDAIGTSLEQTKKTNTVEGDGYITVQRPDGSRAFYEVRNPELFKLLSAAGRARGGLEPIARITRTMSMLTTGGNPLFAATNVARDFQQSVNQGSWAYTYADGAVKWLLAAYDVMRKSDKFSEYEALGGGGWTRIDMGRKRTAAETDAAVFKGYDRSSVGKTAKWAGKKLWNATTLAKINEVLEQTSRFVEYKYGKHDTSTATGRREAFLASQDVTGDFTRSGNGGTIATLKQVVPFLNASIQGTYKLARMVTDKTERPRAGARFAKTIVNQGLASALAALMIHKFCDEDDQEELAYLPDNLKTKYLLLPNPSTALFGEAPYIQIPLSQDPLAQTIHVVVTNAALHSEAVDAGMEWTIDLLGAAETILDGLNPFGSTVFDPLISLSTNKDWKGSNIVPTRMQNMAAANQYDETTPQAFVDLGRATDTSPLKLLYVAKQYSGFLGQVFLPMLVKDEQTGESQGVSTIVNTIRNKFTADPLKSNKVVGAFYDASTALTEVSEAARKGQPATMLRRGLTEEELRQAGNEAYAMVHSGGVIYDTKEQISELYDEIDEINKRADLSDSDKYELASVRRREIVSLALTANEAYGEFKEKYITGLSVLNRWQSADTLTMDTSYDKTPEQFRSDYDQGKYYAVWAHGVWEKTKKESALPSPKMEFDLNNVNYVVDSSYQTDYVAEYMTAYEDRLADISQTEWDEMSDEEKLNVLKSAHTKASAAAKKWYISEHGIEE